MKKNKSYKIGILFAIFIFCLASISASYSGFIANLNIYGEVDTYTPSGDCRSTGFWKTDFKYWITDPHQGQSHVPYDDLVYALDEIFILYYDEVLGCDDPSIGPDEITFQQAYDILSITGGTMEQKLKKQLLAAELNCVLEDYQADDNELFKLFIRQAEEAIVLGTVDEFEYYKDLLESYNTLN